MKLLDHKILGMLFKFSLSKFPPEFEENYYVGFHSARNTSLPMLFCTEHCARAICPSFWFICVSPTIIPLLVH